MSCSSSIEVSGYVFKWEVPCKMLKHGVAHESDLFYAGAANETIWRMEFYPSGVKGGDDSYMACELIMIYGPDVKLSGEIILKCINGNKHLGVHKISERLFEQNSLECVYKLAEKNIVYSRGLQLYCRLSTEERETLPYIRKIRHINQVVSDIQGLLLSEKETNVSIMTKDQKELRTHKFLLAARSEYFAAMFRNDMKENLQRTIEVPDMDSTEVKQMLQYIYSGNLSKWSIPLCKNLYIAGIKYKISGLKEICSEYLKANKNVEVATRLLILADIYADKDMKKNLLYFIRQNKRDVLNTSGWKVLTKEHPHLVEELILSF